MKKTTRPAATHAELVLLAAVIETNDVGNTSIAVIRRAVQNELIEDTTCTSKPWRAKPKGCEIYANKMLDSARTLH